MFSESNLEDIKSWPVEAIGRSAIFMNRGYSYKTRENRMHSDMSSGAPASRLLTKHTITDHTGTLHLTAEELMYFDWWYANEINHGNSYFKIDLMTGAGRTNVAAMFAKNGKGAATLSGLRYTVTCKLITVEQPVASLTEQEVKDLMIAGSYQLEASVNGLRKFIHEAW
jgi:hypothetical protein